ncbi:MAG: helix-turn-helix domain-containing protein [Acidimicrobiales bacterium]
MTEHHDGIRERTVEPAIEQFALDVGARLRAMRLARGLSLEEVQRSSGGRWSASAIGAYERGFRNLSVPRLKELADFYAVPVSVLLGEVDGRLPAEPGGLDIDLDSLAGAPDAASLRRYLRAMLRSRGRREGPRISALPEDVRALCALLGVGEAGLRERLQAWGAINA